MCVCLWCARVSRRHVVQQRNQRDGETAAKSLQICVSVCVRARVCSRCSRIAVRERHGRRGAWGPGGGRRLRAVQARVRGSVLLSLPRALSLQRTFLSLYIYLALPPSSLSSSRPGWTPGASRRSPSRPSRGGSRPAPPRRSGPPGVDPHRPAGR